MNQTKEINQIKWVDVSSLHPHPNNRPLGLNDEVIEQIRVSIEDNGFFIDQALSVRIYEGTYQIVKGEHRFEAAKLAGLSQVPVYVYDWDEEEARIQILIGNIQTGNNPLDIGLAALDVVDKKSKEGYNTRKFSDRIGKGEDSVSSYMKAASVWKVLKCSDPGRNILNEAKKLLEISRTPQSDWSWLHDHILEKGLSKNETIDLCRKVRDIATLTDAEYFTQIFDLEEVKKGYATGKREFKKHPEILKSISGKVGQLPRSVTTWKYNTIDDEVISKEVSPKDLFVRDLADLREITIRAIAEKYTTLKDILRTSSKDKAESDARYYREEKNEKERIERIRLEKEKREFKNGEWWQIGEHKLYCGSNMDNEFIHGLPNDFAFSFADPPYNEDVDEWDRDFVWEQNYLQDISSIVFVTPGISQLQKIIQEVGMNYRWTLATWIKNGMTRGAVGFGNWMMTLVYSLKDSIHNTTQDFNSVTIDTSGNKDHYHKGKKPNQYIDSLLDRFSKEGEKVLDPFLGSGTTLFRAHAAGRICFGSEINEGFFKRIVECFESETNLTAYKI